jgi:O-methyltransferase involved in polyketide biosynthesis
VPIDFARETLADKLAPWAGARDVLVVMEGVSMYLRPEQWRQTAQTLQALLPAHELICDLVDATFVRRFSGPMRREIQALGGDFAPAQEDPVAEVEALGYRRRAVYSVVERAVDYGALTLPRWLLRTLLRSLRDGYRIAVFDAAAASG